MVFLLRAGADVMPANKGLPALVISSLFGELLPPALIWLFNDCPRVGIVAVPFEFIVESAMRLWEEFIETHVVAHSMKDLESPAHCLRFVSDLFGLVYHNPDFSSICCSHLAFTCNPTRLLDICRSYASRY